MAAAILRLYSGVFRTWREINTHATLATNHAVAATVDSSMPSMNCGDPSVFSYKVDMVEGCILSSPEVDMDGAHPLRNVAQPRSWVGSARTFRVCVSA